MWLTVNERAKGPGSAMNYLRQDYLKWKPWFLSNQMSIYLPGNNICYHPSAKVKHILVFPSLKHKEFTIHKGIIQAFPERKEKKGCQRTNLELKVSSIRWSFGQTLFSCLLFVSNFSRACNQGSSRQNGKSIEAMLSKYFLNMRCLEEQGICQFDEPEEILEAKASNKKK